MSAQGLPVSRLINVTVTLTPVAAQAPNLNTALIIGSSDVIDVEERIRAYSDIEEVAGDFGTTDPEYQAATLFFGQKPQPNLLYIGRWAETATEGLLETGAVTIANQANAVWNAITTGAFFVRIDGNPYAVTGLNFAATGNMNAVAAIIQTAVAAFVGGSTVVWDAENNRFLVRSGTTGALSSVSFLAAPTATGKATFSGNPTAADTLTLNGTAITFVASGASGNQVNIGVDLPTTLASLLVFLRGSVDVQLVKFQYSVGGSVLYLNAASAGAGGNALTTTKSSTVITLSGATLAGATGVDISHIMAGLSTDGGNLVQGITAETPVQAVVALDQARPFWYMVTFASLDLTNDQITAVSAYIEAANNKHVFGVSSMDANCANPASTTDIAYVLKSLNYDRSFVQYSSTIPYAISSWIGRAVTVNFAGNNTVITMMYKTEPGVIAENLTTTQADALKAKSCNVFVNYNNNTAIIEYGTMASGTFFDDIQDTDWVAYNVQNAIYNALYTSPTKIPQTDAGNHILVNAAIGVLVQAVANGTLAPGQWNSNGFGQLAEGDYLDTGFYVYAQPIYLQSEADRQARKSVPIQIAAKLAGAVHTVDVAITVNR